MSLILEALRKSEAERRRGTAPNVYAELPPAPRNRQSTFPIWIWLSLVAVVFAVAVWLLRSPVAPSAISAAPPAMAKPVVAPPRRALAALPPVPRLVPAPPPVVVAPTMATPDNPVAIPDSIDAPALAKGALVPVAASIEQPQGDRIMRLSDLPTAERAALPPLKLTMHMWNEDPSRRFVILDGNRLHEGNRIGDAVVAAIVADGVVLDWKGRRLKLPIR